MVQSEAQKKAKAKYYAKLREDPVYREKMAMRQKEYYEKNKEKHLESVKKYINIKKSDLILEPSAGNGSFLLNLPIKKIIGIDILPEHESIIEKDFFTYMPPEDCKNVLVIGNPPFGKVSSLAISFFNHASKWANVIAFIVPRTFRRTSVQNRLNLNFNLIYDEELPTKPCCFKPKMAVKCCFQIWKKNKTKRHVS